MTELKPCPFCGGKGKISFKDYRFVRYLRNGEKVTRYRVQVICNRCKARGKPIITDPLVDANPYVSAWWFDGKGPNHTKNTEMFRPYAEAAIEAWNRRAHEP